MGTHMLLFPEQEHLHRWHDSPDAGPPASASWMAPCYNQGGGNTWSKRMAASNADSDSWEVRAFTEDASTSGQWPPRSYSCSFCQREFRTAQALGGHMNVHRRERAQANQLAQLRSSGTEAPTASSDWLTRTNSQDIQAGDYTRAYDHRHASTAVDSFSPSYDASSFRNSSYESTPWRSYSPPYESPRDSGLDLELRLGQRYD